MPHKISAVSRKLLNHQTDNTVIQLLRYTLVGGGAFVVDFAALIALTELLDVYYLVSAAIAFIFGLITNYVLSIRWVFYKRSLESAWVEFGIFALIGVIGLGLNQLFMWTFTEYAHFHYIESKIASTVFVYLWNFFARRQALFS